MVSLGKPLVVKGRFGDATIFEALHIIGWLKKTGCLRVEAPPVRGFVLIRNGLVVSAYTRSSVSKMLEISKGKQGGDKEDWIQQQILLVLDEFANLTEGEFFFFQDTVLKAPELDSQDLSNILLEHGLKADQLALILAHQRDEIQHAVPQTELQLDELSKESPGLHSLFSKPTSKDPSAVSSTDAGASNTILFVDDEAPVREIVSAELRLAGYRVREASGPAEGAVVALGLARSRQPCFAVVVDLGMPTSSKQSFQGGFELVQNLMKNGIEAPVLLTTEKLSDHSRAIAKRLGVRNVVFKPSLSKLDVDQYGSDLRTFAKLLVKLLKEIEPAVKEPRVKEIDNGKPKDPWAQHVLTSMGEQMTDPERALHIANHVLPVAASIASRESEHQEDGLDFHPSDPSHIRKHERIGALRIEVKFNRGNDMGDGYLTDLSEKGAFLQTRRLFPVGEFIRLHVILPYQLGEVAAEARIVWLSYEDSNHDPAPHGMGLAFVGPFIN